MSIGNSRRDDAPYAKESKLHARSKRVTMRRGSGQLVEDKPSCSEVFLSTFGAEFGRDGLPAERARRHARASAAAKLAKGREQHDTNYYSILPTAPEGDEADDRPRLHLARKRSTLPAADDNAVSPDGTRPPEWVSTSQLAWARASGNVARPRCGTLANIHDGMSASGIPHSTPSSANTADGLQAFRTVQQQSYGARQPGISANAHERRTFSDSRIGDFAEEWKPPSDERARKKREDVAIAKPSDPPSAEAEKAAFSLLLTRHSKRSSPHLYEQSRKRGNERMQQQQAQQQNEHDSATIADCEDSDDQHTDETSPDDELSKAAKARARNLLRKKGML